MGIRDEITMEDVEGEGSEGRMECAIRLGEERWKIIGLYVNGDLERKLEGLKDCLEEREEGRKILIGGDFNARTRELGGRAEEEGQGEEDGRRKSRDKKVNKEGKKLIEFLDGRGWRIINGSIKGTRKGNIRIWGERGNGNSGIYVYGGRGETVIGYIIGDEEVIKGTERIEIGKKVDSDHHPVIAWIKGRGKSNRIRENSHKHQRRRVWDE